LTGPQKKKEKKSLVVPINSRPLDGFPKRGKNDEKFQGPRDEREHQSRQTWVAKKRHGEMKEDEPTLSKAIRTETTGTPRTRNHPLPKTTAEKGRISWERFRTKK